VLLELAKQFKNTKNSCDINDLIPFYIHSYQDFYIHCNSEKKRDFNHDRRFQILSNFKNQGVTRENLCGRCWLSYNISRNFVNYFLDNGYSPIEAIQEIDNFFVLSKPINVIKSIGNFEQPTVDSDMACITALQYLLNQNTTILEAVNIIDRLNLETLKTNINDGCTISQAIDSAKNQEMLLNLNMQEERLQDNSPKNCLIM
jgi:hypothetical protein